MLQSELIDLISDIRIKLVIWPLKGYLEQQRTWLNTEKSIIKARYRHTCHIYGRSAHFQFTSATASWWTRHSSFVRRRNLRSLLHLVQQTNSSRWEPRPFWDLWDPFAVFDASLWYLSNTVLHNGTFFPLTITQTLFFHFLAVSLPECFSNNEGDNVPSHYKNCKETEEVSKYKSWISQYKNQKI